MLLVPSSSLVQGVGDFLEILHTIGQGSECSSCLARSTFAYALYLEANLDDGTPHPRLLIETIARMSSLSLNDHIHYPAAA